jgi:hypothetical protein
MPASTQYFSVSIEDGESQGVYCAYCGKKIVPTRDEATNGFVFQCDCADAKRERDLYEQKAAAESELGAFLENRSEMMQINELRTRIVVYEQYTHEMKKRLQALINKTAGVEEKPGVSELHINLTQLPMQMREELDLHMLAEIDDDEPSEVLDTTIEDAEAQQEALEAHLESVDLGDSESFFRLDDDDDFDLPVMPDIEEIELDDKSF